MSFCSIFFSFYRSFKGQLENYKYHKKKTFFIWNLQFNFFWSWCFHCVKPAAVCFDQLWPFFGCACGVCGGVAPKQRSTHSEIIHLVQRQAAAALLTLSLRVAGYNSRRSAVDTGPHSHIPPWRRNARVKGKGVRYQERDKLIRQSYIKVNPTSVLATWQN